MKTALLAALLFVSMSSSANDFNFDSYDTIFKAQPLDTSKLNYEWRDQDTVRAVVLVLGHMIDANQTKHLLAMNGCHTDIAICRTYTKQPDFHESESSWIIGSNPSNQTVNLYFIALSALEIFVASELPQGWRDAFQYVRIIDTGNTINQNNRRYGLGFKIGF